RAVDMGEFVNERCRRGPATHAQRESGNGDILAQRRPERAAFSLRIEADEYRRIVPDIVKRLPSRERLEALVTGAHSPDIVLDDEEGILQSFLQLVVIRIGKPLESRVRCRSDVCATRRVDR